MNLRETPTCLYQMARLLRMCSFRTTKSAMIQLLPPYPKEHRLLF